MENSRLFEIGQDIASLYGGSCICYRIDKEIQEVGFICELNDEEFYTTRSFAELLEKYNYKII